jgi:DNA-binding response OmpR family regulator
MKPESRRPDGQPVRVLVVDDESTLAELLSMALRYEGWEVRSAPDGQSGVRLAREFRPDAVVLDVRFLLMRAWVFRARRTDPTEAVAESAGEADPATLPY